MYCYNYVAKSDLPFKRHNHTDQAGDATGRKQHHIHDCIVYCTIKRYICKLDKKCVYDQGYQPIPIYIPYSIKLVNKIRVFPCIFQRLIEQIFNFGQTCGHAVTHNLTVDNQRGGEDKDQKPEVKLSTQREID